MIDKSTKNKYGHYYYRLLLRFNPDDVFDKKIIDILSRQDNKARFIKNAILHNSSSLVQDTVNEPATLDEMKEFAEDNFPEFDDETLNSHDSDASNTNNQKSDTYIASDENKKSQNENKPHVSFDMFLKGND